MAVVAPLDLQLFVFLVLVLLGMAVGFLFDLVRAWRRWAHPGRFGQDVSDLVFLAAVFVFLLGGLLFTNWGELRLFVFLGIGVGLLLYSTLASAVVVRALGRVFLVVDRFAGGLARAGRHWGRLLAGAVGRQVGRLDKGVRSPLRRFWGRIRFTASRLSRWWRRLPGFL